ncbi:leucyl aminopeptidase [Spiroplasma helicoides]|uniref:Probable cytosol aminopeptidase n=1 Tax=Spiroplasma helicoides TaxID=216938 RepID=A0A1B3SM65_9MOLU|nr:M17 family metallopeptidase [Spiroplasma helicoides]AOG61024.1 leucyl aminopeptidase [Spiroplasma helicoides]
MITINKEKQELTLIAFDKEKIDKSYIIKEHGVTSLDGEKGVICFCIDKSQNFQSLNEHLQKFLSGNKYNLNIDLDSFVNLYENKEEVFQLIVECVFFQLHLQYSLKEKTTNNKNIINILFDKKYESVFKNSEIKMEFVNFARDLQDLPPNVGTSVYIAEKIQAKAKNIKNLKVTILDKKEIEKKEMGLLLGVNAGSSVDARVVILEYVGDSSKKRTAYVGKGITFDSGGYNLKGSANLVNMKFDMSGAAIVSSTVMALAKKEAKCNVVSVALLTDNRIGSKATLTSSVLKSMNGKTVEIGNTDAEGRLVLADGLTYAIRELQAERLITIATLTGAIRFALGNWYTGSFTNDMDFYQEFEVSAQKAQEKVWRLPMDEEHLKVMQASKIADITNSVMSGAAGSSTAAAFLNSFAENKSYIHLDIAGTAYADERGHGTMTRTLFELSNK